MSALDDVLRDLPIPGFSESASVALTGRLSADHDPECFRLYPDPSDTTHYLIIRRKEVTDEVQVMQDKICKIRIRRSATIVSITAVARQASDCAAGREQPPVPVPTIDHSRRMHPEVGGESAPEDVSTGTGSL